MKFFTVSVKWVGFEMSFFASKDRLQRIMAILFPEAVSADKEFADYTKNPPVDYSI